MTGLRLITSAAYIEQELAIEFGQIPPAFLPIGVSPLYEAQIANFRGDQPIYLTIPESYRLQSHDRQRLADLGVRLVHVPQGLSLGNSILYALNVIDAPHDMIEILHGDTLIEDIPCDEPDCVAIHREGDDYSWAAVDLEDEVLTGLEAIKAGADRNTNRPVACGYFSFGKGPLLIRAITRAGGDFISGLDLYTKERPLIGRWVKSWKDFGHIQTYFRSRRSINTARSFNKIKVDPLTVRKSSRDSAKIAAEIAWFAMVPAAVKPYCVRVFENGISAKESYYTTEYQYAPTLSELLVFSSIGRSTWRNILTSCQAFLTTCAASTGPGTSDAALAHLAIDKTVDRLERYARETGFAIDGENNLSGKPLPSLLRIADEASGLIDVTNRRTETVMHGDFCFSNILYNSRAARISVIDPRGYIVTDQASCYGDLRYDLAKFSHSIDGCYDHIIAGRYRLDRPADNSFDLEVQTGSHHSWLRKAVSELDVDGFKSASLEIKALTIGLFLSMLPLHADRPDRQGAFIATALRLYDKLDRTAI